MSLGAVLGSAHFSGGPGSNSAECAEAMEAFVPRSATGVLDDEIGAHLMHTAVDTRISISVIMPHAGLCVSLCTSRRGSAGQDAPWEARTHDLEVNSLRL